MLAPWAGGETRKWSGGQSSATTASCNTMDCAQPLAPLTQSKLCKYKLRNNKRTDSEDESIKVGPKKRGPKPRLRSAGMSRYRRKEANARERQRQGEINTSFDRLREKIPHPGPSNGKCEKLRKIDILRVSIMYIRLVQTVGREAGFQQRLTLQSSGEHPGDWRAGSGGLR